MSRSSIVFIDSDCRKASSFDHESWMALLNSKILEQYPDIGRGESCLVVGFAGKIPIHVVCGWRGEKVVLITVYIPRPPKFIDPWTRGERRGWQ